MLIATIVTLSLLLVATDGFPTQPGTCNSPQPFGNAHLRGGDYRGGTSLSSFGLKVFIGNTQLIEDATFDVPLNEEVDIELNATRGLFKGYLIKLVKDGLDTTDMLISDDITIRDDLATCVDLQSGSLSHTNNNQKSSIKGKILIGSEANLSGLKLEVTVAIQNDVFSEWYQSSFALTASAVVAAVPTSAPTIAATAAPTRSPQTPDPTTLKTVAPTHAPKTAAPTNLKTAAPTNLKTAAPTNLKTSAPTRAPKTPAPTKLKTAAPTLAPKTSAPTTIKTAAPTRAPKTSAPTTLKTATPTRAPKSLAPTTLKTAAPTKIPKSASPATQDYGTSAATTLAATYSPATKAPTTIKSSKDWYPSLKKKFIGTRLKKCNNQLGVPPVNGSSCGGKKKKEKKKEKTCFFGDKACPTVSSFPETRCFCDGSKWLCSNTTCPLRPTDPIQ